MRYLITILKVLGYQTTYWVHFEGHTDLAFLDKAEVVQDTLVMFEDTRIVTGNCYQRLDNLECKVVVALGMPVIETNKPLVDGRRLSALGLKLVAMVFHP